jgi:hypothetical protein
VASNKKNDCSEVSKDSLQQKGSELVQGVGKGVLSFFTTAYGRLMTALLAFDKRTREAKQGEPKPADRIATVFFNSIIQAYKAVLEAKK